MLEWQIKRHLGSFAFLCIDLIQYIVDQSLSDRRHLPVFICHHCDCWLLEGMDGGGCSMKYLEHEKPQKKIKLKFRGGLSVRGKSHYRGGSWLCSALHQALSDVVTVDLAQRRAQRVDAGTVLARPVRQECTNRMLFLPEGRNSLILITQEARQIAPVAVIHVVAVVSFAAPVQQLLQFLPGVERKQQTRLFIHGDNCREEWTSYFIIYL